MRKIYFCSIFTFLFLFFVLGDEKKGNVGSTPKYDNSLSDLAGYSYVLQGFQLKLCLSNNGILGEEGPYNFLNRNVIGCEYLENPTIEHITGGGIWIGAIIDTIDRWGRLQEMKCVTTTNLKFERYPDGEVRTEMMPFTHQSWYQTSTSNQDEPNRRDIDDDGDGKIDEDELDGFDNDGDGKIDEDYSAFSESDYYCGYIDTLSPIIEGHIPLGIKIWQRSYAWAYAINDPIIPIEYYLINVGKRRLKKVYVGLNILTWVGPYEIFGILMRNVAGYWPDLRTAFVYSTLFNDNTPVGITILETPKPLNELKYYSYRWFFPYEGTQSDSTVYNILSGVSFIGTPNIMPNQDPGSADHMHRNLFSFGPIEEWNVGETLKVSIAIICGLKLEYSTVNLRDVARRAITLYARDFVPPFVISAPKIRIEPGFRNVMLSWGWDGAGINPIDAWDEANKFVRIYPPDHWRRKNPPTGKTTGGRIFEGYRLYRSEDPAATPSSFTMLKQWDMIDSGGPRFGYDTGIETTFVDENLKTGKIYWYSVTSFGIPDVSIMDYVDWDGTINVETLKTEGVESFVLGSRKRIKMPFSVSHELNKVLVVPNPYRVDEEYTFEMGGYEGRAKSWTENKRSLKFIHLPPKCIIRIFTLTGDMITTLYHENAERGELDWNLISESNRAIASGVYVFTVESEYGTQMGKFVVIR